MDPAVITGWIQLGSLLTTLGIDAVARIKKSVRAMHPDATGADLDAIIDGVIADATRRKALADNDAAGRSE